MPSVKSQPKTDLDKLSPKEGIALFTDGSSWAKDGSGGWAWIAIDAFDGEASDAGYEHDTTVNRMEMQAWVEGLTAVFEAHGACRVLVYSDSEYVGLGAMDHTRARKKNRDWWEWIDKSIDAHLYVEFVHVRGHDGHKYNERADEMAGRARREGNQSA